MSDAVNVIQREKKTSQAIIIGIPIERLSLESVRFYM